MSSSQQKSRPAFGKRAFFRRAALVALVAVVWLPVAVVLVATWDGSDEVRDDPPQAYSPCLSPIPEARLLAGAHALPCSPCNRVELYDYNLAITGKPGSNAGFEGSGLGCVPVCVWQNDDDSAVEPEEVRFMPVIPYRVVISGHSSRADPQRNYLFKTSRAVFGSDAGGLRVALASSDPEAMPSEVWLTPDQQSCQVYDARGHIVEN